MRGTLSLRCTIRSVGDRPSGQTDMMHPLVQLASEATRLGGRDPELRRPPTPMS
jgi:hypothetical protein